MPTDLDQQVERFVKSKFPDVPNSHLDEIKDTIRNVLDEYGTQTPNGLDLTGNNLLNAKNKVSMLISQMPGDSKKVAYGAAHDVFDKLVEDGLNPAGARGAHRAQLIQDLADWKAAKNANTSLVTVESAGQTAKRRGGEFRPDDLSAAAYGRDPLLADLGKNASAVTREGPTNMASMSRLGFGLGSLGLGTSVFGAIPTVATLGATTGLGHVLANQGTQRAVMGDTSFQRALMNLMRKNPNAGDIARRLATTGILEDVNNEP
jgi:hypothetical protein